MLVGGAAVTIHTQMLDVTIVQVHVLRMAVAGGLATLVLTLNFLREMRESAEGSFLEVCRIPYRDERASHICKV